MRGKKVFLVCEEGQIILDDKIAFSTREDYVWTYNKLQELNKIKIGKTQIGEKILLHGYSVWEAHQKRLIVDILLYSKYKEVINTLKKKNIKYVNLTASEGGTRNLHKLYKILEVEGFKITSFKTKQIVLRKKIIDCLANALLFLFQKTENNLFKIFKRNSLLVYSVDLVSDLKYKCDTRQSKIYEYLAENNKKFSETLFSNRGIIKTLDFFIKRKRLVYYLNPAQSFGMRKAKKEYREENYKFKTTGNKYFDWLIKYYLMRSISSIHMYNKLAPDIRKIDILISVDDPRNNNELLAVCKELGIKSYGFQHGFFFKIASGWEGIKLSKAKHLTYDKLFVWNKYCKDFLLSYSKIFNNKNVEIGGFSMSTVDTSKFKRTLSGKKKILLISENVGDFNKTSQVVDKIINSKYELIIKIRPDETPETVRKRYNLSENFKNFRTGDMYKSLADISICIGSSSTALYNALYVKIPVVQIVDKKGLGIHITQEHITISLEKPENTIKVIEKTLKTPRSKWNKIAKKLTAQNGNIEKTLSQILN